MSLSLLTEVDCSADRFECYADEWKHMDDDSIVDVGIVYSSDVRDDTTSRRKPAPTAGVKALRTDPSHNEIAILASGSFGFQSSDRRFTLFVNTLRVNPKDSKSDMLALVESDKIVSGSFTYTILSMRLAVYDTQLICLCRRVHSQASAPI